MAIPADQRGRRTSKRGSDPPKLGDMEKPQRPPAHLQDDPGAHGTRRVRRVPGEHRTGDNRYLWVTSYARKGASRKEEKEKLSPL